LDLFGLDPEEWDVSLQCLSGCVANVVAYSSVLDIGDKVLAMNLSEGGHLSHGFKLGDKVISHTAKYYNWDHYGLDENGFLDYGQVEQVNFLSVVIYRWLLKDNQK
jgi:glycine hydroxymethyltransferase